MSLTKSKGSTRVVRGPHGEALTAADLPDRNTSRWTARKKAIVVACVRGGLVGLTEIGERYSLSVDEFMAWEEGMQKHGLDGLKTRGVLVERLRAEQVNAMIG